jgi:hypothetical protein
VQLVFQKPQNQVNMTTVPPSESTPKPRNRELRTEN